MSKKADKTETRKTDLLEFKINYSKNGGIAYFFLNRLTQKKKSLIYTFSKQQQHKTSSDFDKILKFLFLRSLLHRNI
jgi:hypothetical protein